MKIYLYPLNSLEDLPVALQQGSKQVSLYDATSQHDHQAVQTQVNGAEALGVVTYAQDYFSLANYALLYEINEADPCQAPSSRAPSPK